jgi:hypothetical protein
MKLLMGVTKAPMDKFQGMIKCGLAYVVPAEIGVRKYRQRTSAAGLALLDFWAEKYPKFAPFVTAFVHKKDREEIKLECFDFTMGNMPLSYRQKEKANKENLLRAQGKKYRKDQRIRMKQEVEEQRRRQQQEYFDMQQNLAQQQMLNPQYMAQHIQNQYSQLLNSPNSNNVGLYQSGRRSLLGE